VRKRRLLILIVIPAIILISTGVTLGLNGFFGGGGSLPEDTFTRGLVGYWGMDEGYGTTTYDGSNYGNNGTMYGGMATTSWATGKIGGALSFDGVDDYVDIGTTNLGTGAVTTEWWVKPNVLAIKPLGDFIFGGGLLNYMYDTGGIEFGFRGHKGRNLPTGSLVAGNWTHIVLIYNGLGLDDGTNYSGFVNGVSKTITASVSSAIGGTTNRNYIATETGGLFSNTIIDEVRIYNRALSAAEVRYHYNRGGPVAQWKMDEGDGRMVYDSTGNNNDGTLILAGSATSSAWVSGKYGSALSFDGVDDYVSVSDSSSLIFGDGTSDNSFSVEAWINMRDATKFGILSKAINTTSPNAEWGFYSYTEDKLLFNFWDDTGAAYISRKSNTALTDYENRWIHVAASYDGSESASGIILYLNGSVLSSTVVSGGTYVAMHNTATPVTIGAVLNLSGSWSSFANGLIDDVRIYSYARTADEIRLDYNAGFGAKFGYSLGSCQIDPASCVSQGLVGYWSMDERYGTSTADLSGNGNDGMMVGGMATTSWATGKIGGALKFDGVNDYVQVPTISFADQTEWAVELWAKPAVQEDWKPFLSSSGSFEYLMYHNNPAGIWFRDANGNYFSVSLPSFGGVWDHIVVSVNSSRNMKVYRNGQYMGVMTPGSTKVDFIEIGGKSSSSYYFNGLIDEVRIYNRALSADEVRYHYNQGGPVAQWKMDEGSGSTAYDVTDNNNDGTISGAAWTTGKYGSALSFDGVDDYVDVADSSSLTTTNLTVSAWIKSNSIATEQTIVSKFANEGGGAKGFMFEIYLSKVNIAIDTNVQLITLAGGTTLLSNTWYYVTATYDGSTIKAYVNGVLDRSKSTTAGISDTVTVLNIGRYTYASNLWFNGLIDDVRIYNYARTPEQIRLDYNAGLAAKLGPSGKDCNSDPASCVSEGLIGYWNFDERSGTSTADLSGNGNDGMMVGGMATTSWTTGIKPFTDGTKGGGALKFDGVDDYVSGTIPQLTSNAFTVSFWFYWQNNPATYEHPLTLGDYDISFYIDSTGYFAITGDQSTVISGALSTNKWYFVTDTFDGTAYKIYLNGGGGQPAAGSLSLVNNDFYIGSTDTPHNFFKGVIDEVRVYNRALSAEEVRYHYNKGGPVAQWKMDEGEGTTAYDSTNNNNDGTISGAAWVEGKYGSALSFDGVNDYVNAGTNSVLNLTAALTVEAWVKPASLMNDNDIVGRGTADATPYKRGYRMGCTTGGKFYFAIRKSDDSAWVVPTDTVAYTNGVWYHLVGTFNGTASKLYVNGILKATTYWTGAVQNTLTHPLTIGAREELYGFFNGSIDDVRIYKYARTEEQIKQDYNAGLSTHFK